MQNLLGEQYDTALSDGLNEYQNYLKNSLEIVTGIESFDFILKNVNLQGKIIEICGSSGCGKTQLCLTLLANITKTYNIQSLFINTKCDFSIERFIQILQKFKLDQKEVEKILENIKIENIFDIEKLMELFKRLDDGIDKHFHNLKLIIIDSLPSLLLMFDQQNNNLKRKYIIELGKLLKKIAQENYIIVITVNFTIDNKYFYKTAIEKEMKHLHLAIGKHWYHVPSYRFLIMEIDEDDENEISELRKIFIWNSINLKRFDNCFVIITENGVE